MVDCGKAASAEIICIQRGLIFPMYSRTILFTQPTHTKGKSNGQCSSGWKEMAMKELSWGKTMIPSK